MKLIADINGVEMFETETHFIIKFWDYYGEERLSEKFLKEDDTKALTFFHQQRHSDD